MKVNLQNNISFTSNTNNTDNNNTNNIWYKYGFIPDIKVVRLKNSYKDHYKKTVNKANKYIELCKKNKLAKEASKRFQQVIPICDSFVQTALTEGSLESKLIAGSTNYIDNFVVIHTNKTYDKSIDKSVKLSSKIRNFSTKHPTLAFTLNLLSGVAITKLVMLGYTKLKEYGNTQCKGIINPFRKKAHKVIYSIPCAKFFDEKILQKIAGFVSKNPTYCSGVALFIDACLLGKIIKNIYEINKLDQNDASHYEEAKNVRYEAARGTVGNLMYFSMVNAFLLKTLKNTNSTSPKSTIDKVFSKIAKIQKRLLIF